MSLSTPTKHDGRAVLFEVAELFVYLKCDINVIFIESVAGHFGLYLIVLLC